MRILIDSNALVLLIIGLIDQNLISKHKRTSIYRKKDFEQLLLVIDSLENLIILPNIWTEVDNLLNSLSGSYKYPYIQNFKKLVELTTEEYLNTKLGSQSDYFMQVGLTDVLIIDLAKHCDFIITADSTLSDLAIANGITVYDLVQIRNKDLRN